MTVSAARWSSEEVVMMMVIMVLVVVMMIIIIIIIMQVESWNENYSGENDANRVHQTQNPKPKTPIP